MPTWSHCQILLTLLFFLSGLVTGTSFTSISSLVLKLWQFCFMRDWPEILKSEIRSLGFYPISADWFELGIPNLAWMSLIKCYWILQNTRASAFTIFALLKENQHRVKVLPPPRPDEGWVFQFFKRVMKMSYANYL